MLTHAMIVSDTSVDLHWSLVSVPKKGCHSNGKTVPVPHDPKIRHCDWQQDRRVNRSSFHVATCCTRQKR